jgi:L-ascorbate 6-phosphate lactonase
MHNTNTALIEEINQASVPRSKLKFWWLGQHSFILKLGEKVLYIDLYLKIRGDRLVPPFFKPEEVTNADLFFGSHDHSDHIDRPCWPQLAEASHKAKFIVPKALLPKLSEDLSIAPARFVGMDDGEIQEFDGIKVTALASAHEQLKPDPVTGHHHFLGFVIEGNGACIYHPGDTCIYEGLLTKLRKWKRFDVMFLPINGRDAPRLKRNILGNMTFQEAVDLAGELKPRLVMPTHYDMFESNPGDPQAFMDYLHIKFPEVQGRICKYCEAVEV